jgi:very-short-patch-repair endonuclease
MSVRMRLDFNEQCRLGGLPIPVPEHRFHPTRKWRLDWAWPELKVALEVEGGYAVGGRHTRVGGFLKDQEKYNALAVMGWRLLRVTPRDVANGHALTLAGQALRVEMSA